MRENFFFGKLHPCGSGYKTATSAFVLTRGVFLIGFLGYDETTMRLRSVQRICSKIIAPFAGNHDVASGNRVVSEETRHKSATESPPMSYRCPMVVAKWSPKNSVCVTHSSVNGNFFCAPVRFYLHICKKNITFARNFVYIGGIELRVRYTTNSKNNY